jgi:carboxyl-terminal processing protease
LSQPRSRFLIALCLLVAATLVGGALGEKLPGPADRDTPPLDEYADILTTISDWAPEPVSPDKFVYASIHGMLSRLVPHTAFLEPDDYAAMREKQQGSFFGLGIQIQKRMGKITVLAPMEGTPAFKLGIRPGDIITHIEDEELKEEITTDEVVRKLRGPKGTQVTITIRRAGIDEPIRMTITRAEIPTRAVPYAFMITSDTGYIFLRDFTHTSSRELANAIDNLDKQGMKRLMLDLRGNPGGVLDQAVDISDIFLGKGAKVVYTRGRTASSAQDFFAPGEGPRFDKPLVVLVNRGSASASEIVAGAIQDHDRGLIVGQRTWGKGLVQSVYTLPYGAGLALTTARYYTPSGRWIQRDYSDLLAYVNPEDPDPSAPDKPGEETTTTTTGQPFYTDAGRIVFAAGGITPDFLVKNSFDSKLVTQLLARNMFFNFAVQWLPRHPEVKQDLTITPALRQEFFRFVEASKFSTADELSRQWNEESNKNLLDYALRIDIANVRAGLEAGWKVRASGDMQVQKGLTLFDEAARVAALPKKPNPSHAAKTL